MSKVLVAAARYGEVYISRDADGTYRRHTPYRPGAPIEIGIAEVEWAIGEHGLDRIDREFDTWAALEAAVQARIPTTRVLPTDIPLSRGLARDLLPLLREELARPTQNLDVTRVISRLLDHDTVAADPALVKELAELLRQAARPPRQPVTLRPNRPEQPHRLDRSRGFFGMAA
ncbi:hypothetical protein GCG21_01050 [Pseudactinotalea sp. HY160]|uniref:hypothetical protein n=1 Tax=Pseudactinotalea sp. HY160 TaxID=2654490 RepID=UPI00128D1371|nr:hypothetical protein [Pseudactinotalea sp. HY160]MPV48619.1 hypothetical protein [Pseudactinotalea sp. HY160]